MIFVAVLFVAFGLWASAWGVWASYHRPRPYDLLGAFLACLGVAAFGIGLVLFVHPGFLG